MLFYIFLVSLDALHFQIRQVADYRHFPFDLRRLAQQSRNQQPSLTIDLHQLPVVIGAVEKFFLRWIEIREPRQLLLDPLPLLEGIHLSNLSIHAGDVKLRSVLLVDQTLELRGDL